MRQQFEHLTSLIASLPNLDSSHSYSELNTILSEYTKTLNYINSYNENYKRATNVYYNDISSIRDHIQMSVLATTPNQKSVAFKDARNELKLNMEALATLIKTEDELEEITA